MTTSLRMFTKQLCRGSREANVERESGPESGVPGTSVRPFLPHPVMVEVGRRVSVCISLEVWFEAKVVKEVTPIYNSVI